MLTNINKLWLRPQLSSISKQESKILSGHSFLAWQLLIVQLKPLLSWIIICITSHYIHPETGQDKLLFSFYFRL